jgi:peroxiredoxin
MNCPGCKAQLPHLQGAYENLKDSGLTILTIYRSDNPEDVKGYVTSNGISFKSLADPEDRVASKLGFAVGAPISVFVNTGGKVTKYQIGPLSSQEEIEEAIIALQ